MWILDHIADRNRRRTKQLSGAEMAKTRIPGSKGMERAIEYAESNGFDVSINGKSHLVFSKGSKKIVGSMVAKDKRTPLNVISHLRQALRTPE